MSKRLYFAMKRLLDIVFASTVMILFAPLFFVLTLLIKLDSPGPVMFVQDRVGKDGAVFKCFKFRSMTHGNNDGIHRKYMRDLIQGTAKRNLDKSTGRAVMWITEDTRITRVGRLIRRTGLDEIPQFINVLLGSMSMIGPRPPIPYEVAEYSQWHVRRLETKPGISGLWQVYGRGLSDFDDMVEIDIEYIQNQNFLLDIQLIILTPFAILNGSGLGFETKITPQFLRRFRDRRYE